MSDRRQLSYMEFEIFAALFRGKYQGRATHVDIFGMRLEKIEFRAEGANVDAVVQALKSSVENFHKNKASELQRIRLANHKQFLADRGLPSVPRSKGG